MNKATKGAVAAGAAGILLLGGAGTFALWEDNASITGGTVSTGHLDLAVAAGHLGPDCLARYTDQHQHL